MAKRERVDILFKMHADLQDMKRLQQQTQRTQKQLSGMGTLLKKGLGLTVGIASFGALTAATKSMVTEQIRLGAVLRDNAKAFGVSAEFLQIWRHAAEQNSIAVGQADTGLQRFTRRVGEAAAGKGELLDIVKEYGVAMKDENGQTRDTMAVMGDFAEIIKNTRDQKERLRIAFKLFDSEGAKLVNVMADGRDGLEQYEEQLRENNALLETDTVEALGRASDAATNLKKSFTAEMGAITASVWETIEAVMYLREQREVDSKDRLRALWKMNGKEGDVPQYLLSGTNSAEWRKSQIEMLSKGFSEQEILTRVEADRRAAIQERIRLQQQELELQRKAREEAESEREQEQLALQIKEREAAVAKAQAELEYERLSTEDKLAVLLKERAELEKVFEESVLTQEEKNAKLKEWEKILREIVALERQLEVNKSSKGLGGGGDTDDPVRTTTDSVQSFRDQMEDMSDIDAIVLAPFQGMFEGINDTMQELISGTITWEQGLRNVGATILSSVVTAFAQMAAAAVTSYLMTEMGIKSVQAKTSQETMAIVGKTALAGAALIPAAIAMSILNPGAAAAGASAFTVAMLTGAVSASLATGIASIGMSLMGGNQGGGMPGFADGGYTGIGRADQIAGLVHRGEYVMPKAVVDTVGLPALEGIRQGRPGSMAAAGGGVTVIDAGGSNSRLAQHIEQVRGDMKLIKRKLGMVR